MKGPKWQTQIWFYNQPTYSHTPQSHLEPRGNCNVHIPPADHKKVQDREAQMQVEDFFSVGRKPALLRQLIMQPQKPPEGCEGYAVKPFSQWFLNENGQVRDM